MERMLVNFTSLLIISIALRKWPSGVLLSAFDLLRSCKHRAPMAYTRCMRARSILAGASEVRSCGRVRRA